MSLVEQTQIPGLNILIKSKHKWLWTLIILIFVICCVIVLWIWIERFLDNPTYIVLLESSKTEKPFPAVVVCPEISFPAYKIETFIKNLNYPAGLNQTYLRTVMQQLAAFFSPDVPYRLTDLEFIEHILHYNEKDIETAGLNLTASCDETITRCRWRGRFVNCKTLFEMVLTLYGFCCVFNGQSLRREIVDTQIRHHKASENMYGKFDFASGLMLVINQSQAMPFDVDISYKWLSLHSSQRYINLPGNGTPITPGTELFVGYSSYGLQIDEEAVNLDRHQRRCRMSNEALKYFPEYHKKYCLMEIEMKRTLELCGCLKVGHLKLPGVASCGARLLQCAKLASVSIGKFNTECPVTCDVDVDRFTVSSYDLNEKIATYDNFYDDLDFKKVSVIRVYVVSHNRKGYSRKPYFTKFDLFAQLGGLFNVFFGCSVLSIFELAVLSWRGLQSWISSITSGRRN